MGKRIKIISLLITFTLIFYSFAAQIAHGEDLVLISRFTTVYSESNTGRAANIKLATRSLNRITVGKDEQRSFNDIVGERTVERGYQIAKVIESGEYVSGVGGGVCQVSTTFYNALLLAGAKIVEVYNHSLSPGYVPLSRDSMVSYGEFDLKFKGNGVSAIHIYTKAENGTITIDIYGKKLPYIIEPISECIETIYPPKEVVFEDSKGEYQDKVIYKAERYTVRRAKYGYKSRLLVTERHLSDKTLTKTYVARTDTYSAQGAIIVTGTL